jgi:hypothetical protein
MEKASSSSPIDYTLAIKNKGHPPKNVAMGNLRGREEQAGATIRIFLKRCLKLPVQARRHWQNSGPPEKPNGRYWHKAASPVSTACPPLAK